MNVPHLNNTRLPWLDLVRFLAALVVVLDHSRDNLFGGYSELADADKSPLVAVAFGVTRLGHEAVLVFFVLSGMLVGGRAIERIRDGSFNGSAFAIDRTVRIMLPLLPALLFTALVQWHIDQGVNVQHLILNVVSLQGVLAPPFGHNAPLWSLSYEVWFYILVGALGIIVVNERGRWPAMIAVLATAWVFTYLNPTYLLCWLCGAALYFWRPRKIQWSLMSIALLLAVYALTAIHSADGPFAFDSVVPAWVTMPIDVAKLLFSIAVAIILQQLSQIKPKRSSTIRFDNASSQWAAFSYTLYLTHYPVLQLLNHAGIEQFGSITIYSVFVHFAVVGFCLVAAWCLYWCFERHTQLVRGFLKSSIARSITPRAA